VVAVPGPHVPGLLRDLPADTAEAIGRVTFGPMVVLSILTDETEPMPWDDLYSILTPDASFNMFFNHANFLRSANEPKQGSVLMVYAGGDRGRVLLGEDDDTVRDRFLADLDRLFPQVRPLIAETMVKQWTHAGPFAAPGRWRAQAALELGVGGRIFFAGDWVSEFVSMETAARTGVDAAAAVRSALAAG
jgi:oxygen-dependent protoporphyrinogen oxidase